MLLRLFLLTLTLIQLASCSIFSMNEFVMGKRRNSKLLKFPFLVENDETLFKRDLTGTEAILYNNDAYRYSVFVQIGGDTNSMFMNTANYIGWSTENNHDLNIEPNFSLSNETYTAYDINTGNSPSGPVMKGPVVFGATSSNVTIDNVPLADLSDSNVSEQLALGLGLNPDTLSNDFIDIMYSQGLIDSKMFSVFLHNIELNGDIIFGGVDKTLYSGAIKYVDVDTSTVQSSSHGGWYINLDNVKGTNGDYISSSSYVASIDTSTYYSYFPHAIASEMASQLGATEQNGFYYGPCESLYGNAKNFTLTFDNDIEITVSSSQLFYKEDQDGQCDLLFADSSENSVVLGQSLLTSSYLVFDVANRKVGFAQVDTEDSNYTTCDICESVSIICSSCFNVTTSSTKLITSTISTTMLTSTVITHTYSSTFSSAPSISLKSPSSTIPVTASSLTTTSSIISSLSFKYSSSTLSTTFFSSSTLFSFSLSVSSTTPDCGNTYYATFSTILSLASTGLDGHTSNEVRTSTYSTLATYSCSISSLSATSSVTKPTASSITKSSKTTSYLSSSLLIPSNSTSSSYIVPSVSSSVLSSTSSIPSTSSVDIPEVPSTVYLDSSTCSNIIQHSTSSLISVTSNNSLMCHDLYYKLSVLLSTTTVTDNESIKNVIYSQTVSYLTSVNCSDSSSSRLTISHVSSTTTSSTTTSSTTTSSTITFSTLSSTPLTCDQIYYKSTTTVMTVSMGLSNIAVTTSSYSILTSYLCPSYSISSSSLFFTSVTAATPITSVISITPPTSLTSVTLVTSVTSVALVTSALLVKSSSTFSFLLPPSLPSSQVFTDSFIPVESSSSTRSSSHLSCNQLYYASKISTIFSTLTDDNGGIKTSSTLSTFDVLTTHDCAPALSFSPSTMPSFLTSSSVPVSSTESTTTIITTHCNAPTSYTGSVNCSVASISSLLSVPVQILTSESSIYINSNTKIFISSYGSSLFSYKNSFSSSLSYQPVLPETSDDSSSPSTATSSVSVTSSSISFNSSQSDGLSSFLSNSSSKSSLSIPIGSTIIKSDIGTPTYTPINESSTTIVSASSPIVSIYEGSANSANKPIGLLILCTFLLIRLF